MAPIPPERNDPMRDQLLGYLLDALDTGEHEQVEQQLHRDCELQQELELMHESLEPLRANEGEFDPPAGLAGRTCQFVVEQARRHRALYSEPLVSASRWSLADLTVAAMVFFAAAFLFFPAIQHSRTSARLAGCQDNLRRLGVALTQYSERNGGYFPSVPTEGNLSAAGIYAVQLTGSGLLPEPHQLLCPATEHGHGRGPFQVPTPDQLQAATGTALQQLQRDMGGSYGYSLGYVNERGYQPIKNQRRETFALMADAPSVGGGSFASANHGGGGQNVLYEDGHVQHLQNCTVQACRDHIFLNEAGQMAAGVHVNDAVIGQSSTPPLLRSR